MIHSLFLINCSGDIFLEKHWKSVVSQSVCDYFFEAQEKAVDVENVPPVISTPHHYLISIYRDKIFFVSVIQTEVPPLFVIEFLHRVADTFQDYFGECSETSIKDNVVIVYELLEEMLDNGFPLATESNILKELIKPPTILRSVVNSITGSSNVGDTLPTGQLSNIPWRRAGVKYTNNEAYFDVIEEIDAIIDKSGSTVFAEIQGVIDSCIKLSGMPDLSLSFMNPRLLDDVSFHPCIRFKRWESERVLSFIPPDGNFRLISYRVSSQNLVAIPVYVKHMISFKENSSSGRFDVTIGPKQNMGKTVEGVVMTVHMPKAVLNMNLTSTQGNYTFDPVTKHGGADYVHHACSACAASHLALQKFWACCYTAEFTTQLDGNCKTLLLEVQKIEFFLHLATVFCIRQERQQQKKNLLWVLTWDIGKITPQKLPNLKGIVNLQSGAPKPEENPSLNIQFKIQQLAISGLKVNRLDMYGEKYKPFKGVKYITKAGKFQVRT
ncbi:AP-3 complex subunit mu-1 isoform X1 [Apteryx rowi]|uniref:AP-3 complex subunit mu-1 isoform X1 n=1 Tax=Apteryx rowi TaxID=308060 RepID=UPI000E1D8983|nr:AP-3 complex subunit mu-1 isoform X1 [Apteryx rowi]